MPVGIASPEQELEKTVSTTTQKSKRSRRLGREPTTAQDWDGPDDPENPLNWPLLKKMYHTLIPALQCFTMYADRLSLLQDIPVLTLEQHIRFLRLLTE